MSNTKETIPCPSNPEGERPTIPVPADEMNDLLWWDALVAAETPRAGVLRPPPVPRDDIEVEVDVMFDSIQVASAVVDDAIPPTWRSALQVATERANARRECIDCGSDAHGTGSAMCNLRDWGGDE